MNSTMRIDGILVGLMFNYIRKLHQRLIMLTQQINNGMVLMTTK